MKKFKTVDELHQFLERQAKRTIHFYYSDWKNYDRPEIMRHTGEKTKEVYIILRDSGSYLYTRENLTSTKSDFAAVVLDYYTTDRTAKYFKVNFSALTVESIPAGLPQDIKRERQENDREKLQRIA